MHSFERRDRERELIHGPADPPPESARCAEVVLVEGEPVLIHGQQPLDEAGRAAIAEVVRTAKAKFGWERPTDDQVREWRDRLAALPTRGPGSQAFAGRLLAELELERARNAELRPPARELTATNTDERVDELDALPIGSLVLHTDCSQFPEPCVWARYAIDDITGMFDVAYWRSPTDADELYTSADLAAHFDVQLGGSLIVLHEPPHGE